MDEPREVTEARAVLAEWYARKGHDAYVAPLDGGSRGYQAACWDCDWIGPEHLRGDEDADSPEGRAHKRNANRESMAHREATKSGRWA